MCSTRGAPFRAPRSSIKGNAAAFEGFGRTGGMPPELGQWLVDPKAQTVEPHRAFDNVYYVGVRWVSAWLVKTSDGAALLDTLHEPFGDLLISNIRKVGVDPADIKYVLMTHGHFDHVGGAYKLKPLTKARFVMTQTGWTEAIAAARASQGTPRQWTMIEKDMVVKDGDVITLGDTSVGVYEAPGHTFGTASSVTRILRLAQRPNDPITVHLTTHPFSNGLTESAQKLKTRVPWIPIRWWIPRDSSPSSRRSGKARRSAS